MELRSTTTCAVSWAGAALFTLSTTWSAPARADAPGQDRLRMGFQLYVQTGVAALRGEELTPAANADPPPVLQGAELTMLEDGGMIGVGFQGILLYRHLRVGGGAAVYAVEGADYEPPPMPDGFTARTGDPVGFRWDLFVGYELVDGPIYPYIDLRLSMTSVMAFVGLATELQGDLGETAFTRFDAAMGPRLGVLVPLVDWMAIDVSAYSPMLGGHELLTFNAGISFWPLGHHR